MQSEQETCIIEGKTLTFETGKIARQASGAVTVRCGDTIVFAAASRSKEPLEDINFLPFQVIYQEKLASTGKTPGGFIKREGKPTQNEILTCRLIDRPLRPCFPDGYYHDTQLNSSVWSYDGVNKPDTLAICAASAALSISEIPLLKPIGAVRVGMIDDRFIINPTVEEDKASKLDLVIAGSHEAVLMIEGSCDFLTEEQLLVAIEKGHEAIKVICDAIAALQKKCGKEKIKDTIKPFPQAALDAIKALDNKRVDQIVRIKEKKAREEAFKVLQSEIFDVLSSEEAETSFSLYDLKRAFSEYTSHHMREMILNEGIRTDGRALNEVRPITIEQGFLPRTHGSSLFTRGETQAVTICVLGSENMGQRYEDLDGEGTQKFYLQYFFPPYSVGETGRIGMPSRREIGHGKLAERALSKILPSQDSFPYTIRLESNITESNGSSSMASVCGCCLSMMDAGVPIQRPVSGVAMGLILENHKTAILTDILGLEDALGDMDFKVAGDKDGITAFQMDIKIEGITIDIMREALQRAKEGRCHILDRMLEVCPKSRDEMSEYAPRIETLKVKPSKIGEIIGPGGKKIRSIIEEAQVEMNIEDDGSVCIAATSKDRIEHAKRLIHEIIDEPEIGKFYVGKIASIMNFGFFVEVLPGKQALLHISEIDTTRIPDLEKYAKEHNLGIGSEIEVEVLEINDRGQVRLGHKRFLKSRKPS